MTRTVFADVPPRVEYALTDHRPGLAQVMKAFGDRGVGHLRRTTAVDENAAPRRPDG